jgi:hypothetical protein
MNTLKCIKITLKSTLKNRYCTKILQSIEPMDLFLVYMPIVFGGSICYGTFCAYESLQKKNNIGCVSGDCLLGIGIGILTGVTMPFLLPIIAPAYAFNAIKNITKKE